MGEVLEKNAGEWTGRVEINKEEIQALKGEPLSSKFSSDGTLISASAAPHCGAVPRPSYTAVQRPSDKAVGSRGSPHALYPCLDNQTSRPIDTAVQGPSDTAVPRPTDSAAPRPTDTAVPRPSDTAVGSKGSHHAL